MHRAQAKDDPLRVTELRGLVYHDVRCAGCMRRWFRIGRLPGDPPMPDERLFCERCRQKADVSVSSKLKLTKADLRNNPPLPFGLSPD
jgi:hypothetical protein